ncbi:hypothetical protein MSAR_36370 [Mycolicibacterium sarraceniae]|uniref:Uncharacterized protein n=1 Tax=Mycolicibacterium sarraceniae TaxID=1534348 RepID=A0A7I7SW14_9MYCO|nr:hypothetical protein MSAR_36370 [Mycolicibacterium sarraceniae]
MAPTVHSQPDLDETARPPARARARYATGTRLGAGKIDSTELGELPAVEQSIPLAAGDGVKLTRDCN